MSGKNSRTVNVNSLPNRVSAPAATPLGPACAEGGIAGNDHDIAFVDALVKAHKRFLETERPEHRAARDSAFEKIYSMVQSVSLRDMPEAELEEAKSCVALKICEDPSILGGFRGESKLSSYLATMVSNQRIVNQRKVRRYVGDEKSEHILQRAHAKAYPSEGLDALHEGVDALISEAVYARSFARKDPATAGRPTSLRGALDRGLIHILREFASAVQACVRGEIFSSGCRYEGPVSEFVEQARSSPEACREVARAGINCLLRICNACEQKFEALGGAARAVTKTELREIKCELEQMSRLLRGGMCASASVAVAVVACDQPRARS